MTLLGSNFALWPPGVPFWLLSVVFGLSAGFALAGLIKYRDYTFSAMIPSLIYMCVLYGVATDLPGDILHLWVGWGLLGLAVSLLITKIWRYTYYLKRKTWKKL